MTQDFQISLFNNKTDNKPQLARRTWRQLCERFKKPVIRREKDGALFSPAVFEPALRRKENVCEVSLLVLDIDHNSELEMLKAKLAIFDAAFAIYSTHSHLRPTESNPNAEPRFRVCLPLACPIPAADFPALWQYVNQKSGLPLDESAKDASRMFYTPAIAAKDAPYVYYIKDGAFFDWRKLPLASFISTDNQTNGNGHKPHNTLVFEFHEDRHLELCRRIETQATATGRGAFEMKCPAHNGNGTTSLFYDPAKQSVACLKKPNACSYFEILAAFGLPNENLPSREHSSKKAKAEQPEEKPLAIIRASEVTPKKVDWLWYPYIPLNYVTLFSGEEGVGKSFVFCAITSGLTNGFLPLAEPFEPQNVLIFSAEDAADDALVPRLIQCGANLDRVSIVNERFTFDDKGLLRFESYIIETNPAWTIIDPLFAYSDLRLDLNKPHHARNVAGKFEVIAKKYSIAISYLIHFNKSKGGGDARQAVSSSQEFSNAARSIVLIGKDPKDETRRALIHRKHNKSPKGKAIGYKIEGDKDTVNFYWLGESNLTEREIVDRAGSAEEHAEKSEAVAFLRQILRDGRREAGEVIREADKLGITKQQLRTARGKLGIKPYSSGFKDKNWFWELVDKSCVDVADASVDVDKNDNQHLRANDSDKTSYSNDLLVDVDSAKNQHLRAENQHLREPRKCPDCEKELDKTSGGQLFCPLCLACY